MEKQTLASQLEKAFPGKILEAATFGKSGQICIRVEKAALLPVLQFVRENEAMDWLENMSVAEINGSFIFTYFLVSRRTLGRCIIRASISKSKNRESHLELLPAKSVTGIYPEGAVFEQSAASLFGVSFEGLTTSQAPGCPNGWTGFPLRKDFVFPHEVFGIPHSPRGMI